MKIIILPFSLATSIGNDLEEEASQETGFIKYRRNGGMHAKRASAENNNNDNAAACLCFPNNLVFLRPEADRTDSVLPWVVSRGRSSGFL
jgi:hypothetical protein